MPYFVFQINNHREYLSKGAFENYREARTMIRALRAEFTESQSIVDFKMIFASSELEGKETIKIKREKQPSEDNF